MSFGEFLFFATQLGKNSMTGRYNIVVGTISSSCTINSRAALNVLKVGFILFSRMKSALITIQSSTKWNLRRLSLLFKRVILTHGNRAKIIGLNI